jgi:hypothetical protein
MGIGYATREQVKTALGSTASAYDDAEVDDALRGAMAAVDALCHRDHLHPVLATKYWDWPNDQGTAYYRLWLGKHGLISAASLTAGGTAIASYQLGPVNSGPPYDRVEIDLSTSSAFASNASTHQRAIALLGLWGYTDESRSAGTLAEALDASETDIDVTASPYVGVGSLIKVDSERMLVTDRTLIDTTVNLGGNLTASLANTIVPVSSGTSFARGETILIDSERMTVQAIAGNNLIVKRATDGTVLAAHASGADVYAARTLTVERGAAGTTAATHTTSTALTVWRPPALAQQLTIAEAVVDRLQAGAGYARTAGSGENERESAGKGLMDLRKRVQASPLCRKGRTWAV